MVKAWRKHELIRPEKLKQKKSYLTAERFQCFPASKKIVAQKAGRIKNMTIFSGHYNIPDFLN
jgi:hypothetical protein